MKKLTILILCATAIGCEKDPPTREMRMAEYERKEKERLNKYEGQYAYVAQEKPKKPREVFAIEVPPSGAHYRKDCPEINGWPTLVFQIKNGRFVDGKGFMYDHSLCRTCAE